MTIQHSFAATTGSISFDRTIYPVPFGGLANTIENTGSSTPNGYSIFPIHMHSISGNLDANEEVLGEGIVKLYIRIFDADFNTSGGLVDVIAEDRSDQPTGPVTIIVSRGGSEVILAYAGGPVAQLGTIDVHGDAINGTGVRELGPISEISPDSGIFEIELPILYTDGPESANCPLTDVFTSTDGGGTLVTDRFDVAPTGGTNYCIMRGDAIRVEYTDPHDSSGFPQTVTNTSNFELRDGALQTDKSVYIIGRTIILTMIEPDFDLDSDDTESYSLDLIGWNSDSAITTLGNLGGETAAFAPTPINFEETGDSTGIFQTEIKMPEALDGNQLSRAESILLQYIDWGPLGANFVGEDSEDIDLTILTSNFGATIALDQKVYTWTDKVFITIVAPDHNFDTNLVDEIGETANDPVIIQTKEAKLTNYKLVETGADTGIFTGEVILTGFSSHDANGDGAITDASGISGGNGPTDGFLATNNVDGLTVSFEFSEDETVVGSALIRWNIGEISWLETNPPSVENAIVRVVDPDMNLNPESVDNFSVDVWSDSDAGGIDLTVTETNEATGIFEGTVFFTTTSASTGSQLRVSEGDTITVNYHDHTVPELCLAVDMLQIMSQVTFGSQGIGESKILKSISNAGPDQSYNEGSKVTLDGSSSFDSFGGNSLFFCWEQIDGLSVILSDSTSSNPTFIAPQVDSDTTLTFQLIVNDGEDDSKPDFVNIKIINEINIKPVANNDELTIETGNTVSIDVLRNDFDQDDDAIIITSVSDPVYGSAYIAQDKTWIQYVPDAGFSGTDSFTYTISDVHGDETTASVTVIVKNTIPPAPIIGGGVGAAIAGTIIVLTMTPASPTTPTIPLNATVSIRIDLPRIEIMGRVSIG